MRSSRRHLISEGSLAVVQCFRSQLVATRTSRHASLAYLVSKLVLRTNRGKKPYSGCWLAAMPTKSPIPGILSSVEKGAP